MKGDFSKDTFRKKKHFHDVHMQQGRVLLDSDWNEQADIQEHRIETGTLDIVGKNGSPYHYAGFDIVTVDNVGNPVIPPVPGTNIKISEGRFYVDGIMCENDAPVLFASQPDYDKTVLPAISGRYLFYLDVWQRHITVLEDSDLREVALGGPDTTTRNKTVWQVKFVKTGAANTCVDLLPASITDAPTGKLMARTELPTGTEDPCGLAVSGGYRRLENQLYRVEIHRGAANRSGTTFKWSRDNGSVFVKWDSVEASNPNNLVVSGTGRDELLGFKSGDWIEMIDDKTDLLGLRGALVQLSKVDGNVLTINPVTNIPGDATITAGAKNSRIRRWDSVGELKPNTNNTDWIELEDGVQVQFKEGSFRTGDYWLIPARTATADIEWPFADAQSPNGIEHHYAKLGIADLVIGVAPGWVKISDCRPIFPPLTEWITLNYVGGDGQEAIPDTPLSNTLKVGVANGQWAVKDAKIKFEIVAPGVGTLNPANGLVTTNTNGVAECGLTIGKVPPNVNFSIQVKASLLDAAGNIATGYLPVIFSAKLMQRALFYVSGDGQEAMPGANLPVPLMVGVSYDQFPVKKAKVKFIVSGGGSILPATAATTGVITSADGLASCTWKLGNTGLQKVTAILFDDSNEAVHFPIIFNASLNVASNIAYDGGNCANWVNPKPANVADALTALCNRGNKKSCTVTVGREGQYPTLEKAFAALKDEDNICICLLPSGKDQEGNEEHIVKDLAIAVKESVKITGCGATIQLMGELFSISAQKIKIQGIIFSKADNIKSQIRFRALETDVDGCYFINHSFTTPGATTPGNTTPGGLIGGFIGAPPMDMTRIAAVGVAPVLVIVASKIENGGKALVNWTGNLMDQNYTLAFFQGVQGWIKDNIIRGRIALQYNTDFTSLSWKAIEAAVKSNVEKNLRALLSIENHDEVMHIQGNTLNTIDTNNNKKIKIPEGLQQGNNAVIPGYKNLFITDNVFTGIVSSFAAEMMTFSNNHFLNRAQKMIVANLLGYRGIITGNMDEIGGDNGGILDTIFSRRIASNNLIDVR
jgi:hypothetical protein